MIESPTPDMPSVLRWIMWGGMAVAEQARNDVNDALREIREAARHKR